MTQWLIKLFIKDHKNTDNPAVRNQYGMLGGAVGIGCNFLLFIVKLIPGLISGSVSVLADAFNNLSDAGSSAVTLLGFRMAKKPADKGHPFGHGRMEYMSAFLVALLIILLGLELIKSSVEKFFAPQMPAITWFTFFGLFISLAVKLWMYFFNRKLGKLIHAQSLIATARDSLNDCLTTGGVLISMVICKYLNVNIDPYVGAVIGIFVLWSGFMTAKDTLNPLLGEPPSPELVNGIKEEILRVPEFLGIHDLIIHNYGPGRSFASVHVEVPEDIDFVHCHELCDNCEKTLKDRFSMEISIHMDPIALKGSETAKLQSTVVEKLRAVDPHMTIHDFRMVPGRERINLIFDAVISADCKESEEVLRQKIAAAVLEIDPRYCAVVQLDRDFTGTVE